MSDDKIPITCRDVNISDHVAAMFDALVTSLDWGSGFLDAETIESILIVAALAGFDVPAVATGNLDPPGFEPEKTPPLPEAAQVPAGGWPSDRPEVYEEAQRVRNEHDLLCKAVQRRNETARAAAVAAWLAQVQAKARAMASEDDQ